MGGQRPRRRPISTPRPPSTVSAPIEAKVAAWVEERIHLADAKGHRLVVRNGRLPERTILSGVGLGEVQQPRVRDRRPAGEAEKFTSATLPLPPRKTKSLDELTPWL